MTLTTRGPSTKRFLALAGALCLLTAAAPDGCNGLDDVGIDDAHMDPSSPDAKGATAAQPVITTRDNPRFIGKMSITSPNVSSSPSGDYAESGTWNGLGGYVTIDEHKSNDLSYLRQLAPILPRKGLAFSGSGNADFESRTGSLVHGNTYEAKLQAIAPGQSVTSNSSLHVKLSDDVHLVPIVVINWKRPGNDPTFIDWTNIAKKMFDFIPYVKPAHMNAELTHSQTYWVNHEQTIGSPSQYDLPPDDIYAMCGVQFQVVASFVFELPADFGQYGCLPSFPSYYGRSEIESRVRAAAGPLGDAIVDKLRPTFVVYADLDNCWSFGTGFRGKHIVADRIIEIHNRPNNGVTAHELGHVLGLGHADGGDHPNNLMISGVGTGGLKAFQCPKVHERAKVHSDRFRAFNEHMGRVYREITMLDPGNVVVGSGGPPPTPPTLLRRTNAIRCAALRAPKAKR